MRLLGIDFGTKKVGIAISDQTSRFAMPIKVIKNYKGLIEDIKKICVEEKIEKIIIGKSVDYQNQPNKVAEKAEVFAKELEKETKIPIDFEIETLTTKEAEREIGKDVLTDARAAALILKSYLDRHR